MSYLAVSKSVAGFLNKKAGQTDHSPPGVVLLYLSLADPAIPPNRSSSYNTFKIR